VKRPQITVAALALLWAACPLPAAPDKGPEPARDGGGLIRLGKPMAATPPSLRGQRVRRTPDKNARSPLPFPGGMAIPSAAGAAPTAADGPRLAAVPDPAGKPPRPAPKVQGWGRNHAVSNYEDDQRSPSIAKDSQGRLYAAYDWLYSGTGRHEIWMARSADGGNEWEDLFYLADPSFNYSRPSLAIAPNDQCFLFYQTDDTLGLQYLSSAGGDKWDFSFFPSWQAIYPKCHWPQVAAGVRNDSTRVAVAWMYDNPGNGTNYDIGYAYSRDGGGSWLGRPNHIAYSAAQERHPAVCISDSLVAVAYELYGNWAANDSVDVMYARTQGLSAPLDTFVWNAAVNGIATLRHDRQPALAASGRYVYLAGQRAYNDQDDYDILLKHSNDGGKTLRAIDVNESFEIAFPPPDWTNGGCDRVALNPRTGSYSLRFNAAGDHVITPKLANPDSVVFWYRRSTNTNAWACSVQYSASAAGPWTLMGVVSSPTTTYQQYAYDCSGLTGIYVRLKDARTSGGAEERYVDDFWVPATPLVFVAGTGAEERHPALVAQDTACYAAYYLDGAWAAVRRSQDRGNNWSGEELASDSTCAQQEVSGLDVCVHDGSPRVAWTDNRNQGWGLGTDIYFNTDARFFPRSCDLAPYQPTGWQYPLVPSKLRGTYSVSDTLRGMLTTARDTTFVDFCLIDSASVDVADTFRAGLFVDEWLYAYLEEGRLPAWWPTGVIDYPMWVFGGRHTMSLHCDYEERILYERTRDNNIFSRQWVWTPYRLPDDTTLQVPTPPVNVIDPEIPDYNCDGYRQASTNYWSAVGLKPAAGTDYALRVYTDAYGKAEGGFTAVAAESDLGPDAVEVIAIDGNRLTSGTVYYPGVYRGPKTGDGDYYLQFCLQDGTTPANGWSPIRRMGEYQVTHTYDVELTAGTLYYAACSLAAGPASLGFAVFSPVGGIYKPRSAATVSADVVSSPGLQHSFVAEANGWHAFVVWHNTPGKDDTSRYHVGINTVPFGVPLSVSLAGFAAAAYEDSIVLRWSTASETGSYQWLIERGAGAGGYSLLGTLPAAGCSPGPREYRWCDRGAAANISYRYRIGEQALDGSVTYHGPVYARRGAGPSRPGLRRVAPNPFAGSIAVEYDVAGPGQPVRLAVYNVAGQRVRTLADGPRQAGRHRADWDGRDDSGGEVTAGCYLLRWSIAERRGTEKITKVR